MGDRIALGEMDGDHDEQGEFEDWDDAVEEEVRPLFSPRVIFDSVEAALEHDAQTHGFDLRAHAQRLKLDFYGAARLVNFIRSEVAKVHATRGAAADPSADEVRRLRPRRDVGAVLSDAFLRPVIAADGLLCSLDEALDLDDEMEDGDAPPRRRATTRATKCASCARRCPTPTAEMEALRRQLAHCRVAGRQLVLQDAPEAAREPAAQDNDSYYFDSYSKLSIHETMLRDTAGRARTSAPSPSTRTCSRARRCSTSAAAPASSPRFAARAGAKRVVGIDNSAMISHAEKAVAANGYADVITLVRGKLEDTIKAGTLGLAEGEVDVIVSEWMGYGLLYESMLPSVLCARDALLAADGTAHPDVAELASRPRRLGPSAQVVARRELAARARRSARARARSESRARVLSQVHGLDLSCLEPLVVESFGEADVDLVEAARDLTDRVLLKRFARNTARRRSSRPLPATRRSPHTPTSRVAGDRRGARFQRRVRSHGERSAARRAPDRGLCALVRRLLRGRRLGRRRAPEPWGASHALHRAAPRRRHTGSRPCCGSDPRTGAPPRRASRCARN